MATVNDQLELDARAAGYGVNYNSPWRIITRGHTSDTNEVWLRRTVDGAFAEAVETNSSGAILQSFASMATTRTNLGL